MSDQAPQSFQKHARFDSPYHLILFTVLVVNVVMTLDFAYELRRAGFNHWLIYAEWLILLAIAVFIPVLRIRTYPLKVQDRVIRLEERLRLAQLLPEATRSRIAELSEPQLIALRFASDGEVAGLVQQTLDGKWDPKQIKGAVKVWRPDFFRV